MIFSAAAVIVEWSVSSRTMFERVAAAEGFSFLIERIAEAPFSSVRALRMRW